MADNKGKKRRIAFNPYWVYGLVAAALIVISTFGLGTAPHSLSYTRFESELLGKQGVEKIVVVRNELQAEVTLVADSVEKYKQLFASNVPVPVKGPHFVVDLPSIDSFEASRKAAEVAANRSIPVFYEQRSDFLGGAMMFIWPIIFFGILYYFMFRRMGSGSGGVMGVGNSKAKEVGKDTNVNVTFKDVAGLDGAKQELEEIVEFLRRPDKYTELGGKIPKGALLVGPPGTGKTLLAKAVAGEASVPFFSMSGSDFVEMFVGVGASRVRDLFKKAKEKAPSIVFIDEIDAIGRARGRNSGFGSNEERENTLNQLLTEMDGFGNNSGVIILAATNRSEILDPALMRAGRFDRQVQVELPDINEREAIFNVHLRPLKLAPDFDRSFLAKLTPGFSGADIANVCNEAALTAARKAKKFVDKQDFQDAVDRIVGGLEKKNKIMTLEERRTIACHEAGHATVSWLLEFANPLVKVTIVPRGKALGAAWYQPEERQLTTKAHLLDDITSVLGGRAAEDITFGQVGTGALNDLERANKLASAMVTYYGMSDKLPNICYYDSTGQQDYAFRSPYSEERARVIDEEVSAIISSQYERAKEILRQNADKHRQLADLLLEREVIFTEDVERIFGPRPWKNRADELADEKKEEEQAKATSQSESPATTEVNTTEEDTPDTDYQPQKAESEFEIIQKTDKDDEASPDVLAHGIETEYDPREDLSNYEFPSLDLLKDYGKQNIEESQEKLFENKDKIVQTLENFQIKITSIKATVGPTVTLYEIVPAPGIRISKIKNLEDDIAMSLGALDIRIMAPIPGLGRIGIEVPNSKPQIVSMMSVIKSSSFQESQAEIPIAIGKTISNETFVFDLAKTPHLLVAGATGQGKSVGLNAIITSILYRKHPSEIKFVLVDPKKVEFSVYKSLDKHYLAKMESGDETVITDFDKVKSTLLSINVEMDNRYRLLEKASVRNIKEYNEKFIARRLNPNDDHRFLPYLVVIIDEFADLIMAAGEEVETPIARIAQKARAVGIHMILATQRPSTNIITGNIKANFPSRIAFRVASSIDSRTILDSTGAQSLIGRGDMLVLLTGKMTPTRVQCAFVDTPEVERINNFISSQQGYIGPYELPDVTVQSDGSFSEAND